MMQKQTGQIILLLILVMSVALAIGLSVVQKSLVDISTATKVEQSSRAFSAAEAGIERALKGDSPISIINQTFTDTGSKIIDVTGAGVIPAVPTDNSRQAALELPPQTKEDVAQVWLADYNPIANPPAALYTQNTLDIYWGNPAATDKAAIEVTLIYYDGSIYKSNKWYLDNPSVSRNPPNGFDNTSTTCGGYAVGVNTYQCKKILDFSSIKTANPVATWMLIRVRLLYNSTFQPLAIQAVGTCGTACSLPPQARSITSTGASGQTQRKVNVFQLYKVVPPYFDYAIFSAGDITK